MPDALLNARPDDSIPNGWTQKTIGDVVTLQRGKDLPKKERREGMIPVVGSNGIVGYHNESVADGPGVLVGRSGSVGKVTWIDEPYWPLNTALWITDFHGNDPLFVYFLLDSIDLSIAAAGVSVPTLNRNLVHPLPVAIPPLEEQQAIARVLHTAKLAEMAAEKVLAASQQLTLSLVNDLVTGERRTNEQFQGLAQESDK